MLLTVSPQCFTCIHVNDSGIPKCSVIMIVLFILPVLNCGKNKLMLI